MTKTVQSTTIIIHIITKNNHKQQTVDLE